MLWRDLKSERIYTMYANNSRRPWHWHFFPGKILEYDAPEFFIEKGSAPALYRTIVTFVSISCVSAVGLGIIFFFPPEEGLNIDARRPLLWLFLATTFVLFLY